MSKGEIWDLIKHLITALASIIVTLNAQSSIKDAVRNSENDVQRTMRQVEDALPEAVAEDAAKVAAELIVEAPRVMAQQAPPDANLIAEIQALRQELRNGLTPPPPTQAREPYPPPVGDPVQMNFENRDGQLVPTPAEPEPRWRPERPLQPGDSIIPRGGLRAQTPPDPAPVE